MNVQALVHVLAALSAAAVLAWPTEVLPADATLTIFVLDGKVSKLVGDGGPLQAQPDPDPTAAKFTVPLNDRLVSPLLLSATPTDPGASIYPLRIETPLTWSNKSYVVRLKPSKATGTPTEVRAIYSKTIVKGDPQLAILYAEARTIAAARMRALQDNWFQLHDYDVQAVFKVLEIISALNQLPIIPADDVSRFRTWLIDAVKQSPRRVDHAVGLGRARKMIDDIEALQGIRFMALWSFVSNPETPCLRRGRLLRQFLTQFNNLASDEERIVVARTMRLTEGHMLSAIAQCEAIRARCAPDAEVPAIIPSLESLISDIEQARAVADSQLVRTLLGNDLATLSGLHASLAAGAVRSCRDRSAWSVSR